MTQTTFALRAAALALALVFPAAITAQAPGASTAASTQSPPMNGVAHIAIRVKDIAASVAFYQKLGFEQAFAMNKGDVVTQSFIKVNDTQYIELYPVTERDPQSGFLHLCFEGGDLNALHDYYVAQGLTPNAVRKAGAGNLLFTMKGPQQYADPQNIEYTQYMPGSMHSNDAGKHLGANRIANKMVVIVLAMQDPAAARTYYLDKLGFKPAAKFNGLDLPGSSGEMVQIVPVSSLGPRSSIYMSSPDIRKTGELLKSAGINFTDKDSIGVTDPDGNEIHIIPQQALASGKRK